MLQRKVQIFTILPSMYVTLMEGTGKFKPNVVHNRTKFDLSNYKTTLEGMYEFMTEKTLQNLDDIKKHNVKWSNIKHTKFEKTRTHKIITQALF